MEGREAGIKGMRHRSLDDAGAGFAGAYKAVLGRWATGSVVNSRPPKQKLLLTIEYLISTYNSNYYSNYRN